MSKSDPIAATDPSPQLEGLLRWVSKTPLLVGAFLLFLVVSYAIAFTSFGWSKSPDSWGQFGDYIGGILNPIVALCALIALVGSIQLQKVELAATRAELSSTKRAAEEQTQIAAQQRREQRFFDVLRLYQETLRSVEFERSTDSGALSYSGKSAFQFITTIRYRTSAGGNLPNNLPSALAPPESITHEDTIILAKALEQWSSLLDHYFRVIFLLLGEAEPTLGVDHFRYVKYLRAQLSKDELHLLALNMLFDKEGSKMAPWAAKYGLLKHLPPGRLRTYAEARLPAGIFGRKWVSVDSGKQPC